MQITYLHHSGFCVQLPEHTLIFDWVEGQLPKLDPAKPVVAFVSHFHADHFTFDLFRRLAAYPQVHYVLGRDIRRQFSRRFFAARGVEQELYSRIHFVKGGETLAVAGLTVETLTSTDSGVAFLASDGSHSLYHAGDLNWWLWAGEDAAFNRQMTHDFLAQMALIEGRRFDAAFLPLDPRQEADYAEGFDHFMRHTDTAQAWPMHFWEDFSVFQRLADDPRSAPYRAKVAKAEWYRR